jgi:hypothetical protein
MFPSVSPAWHWPVHWDAVTGANNGTRACGRASYSSRLAGGLRRSSRRHAEPFDATKHGPHLTVRHHLEFIKRTGSVFSRSPDPKNLGSCAGVFLPPPLRARFQIGLGFTLFVICLLIASRAAFRSAGFSTRQKRGTHTLRSSLG